MTPRAAFLRACRLNVGVRKPGNVSAESPGHGMDSRMLIASSAAAAPALFAPGASVGTRIEGAVRASVEAAGCNTNLGIVLLVAPLARTLEAPGAAESAEALRAALADVLAALDVSDAVAAYRGIALANPGGLGSVAEHDVRSPAAPTVTLLEAMRAAAPRDRIARQYATGFGELFTVGLPAWRRGADERQAMLLAFVEWLASAPDSHIERKHGHELAHSVCAEAVDSRARLVAAGSGDGAAALVARWDESLKARRLNPGTSADLAVATAFVAGCLGNAGPAPHGGAVLA